MTGSSYPPPYDSDAALAVEIPDRAVATSPQITAHEASMLPLAA